MLRLSDLNPQAFNSIVALNWLAIRHVARVAFRLLKWKIVARKHLESDLGTVV